MLKLIGTKIYSKFIFRSSYLSTNLFDIPDDWLQINDDSQPKVEKKQIKKSQLWELPNNLSYLSSVNQINNIQQTKKNENTLHEDSINKINKNQKKSKLKKSQQKHSIEHPQNIFTETSINKFCRNTNIVVKMQNAQKIVEAISCILPKHQQKQFLLLIKNFVNSEGFTQGSIPTKPTKKQKQLFPKIRNILLDSIQDTDSVRDLMKMFSQTNPNFIQLNQLKKNNQSQLATSQLENRKKTSYDFINFNNEYDDGEQITEQSSKNTFDPKKHEAFEFIKGFEKRQQRLKQNSWKLLLQKQHQPNQFKVDQASLLQVEKKIFGNKKILTQHIVFKKVDNNSNAKFDGYGENWVYAYDLPYQFTKQDALKITKIISSKYGEITQFMAESYQNFVEKSKNQTIYLIPQNYHNQNTKNRVKIEKQKRDNIVGNQKKSPALVSKILKKVKNQKQLSLNKSTMVFKFKNKADKTKFLTQQMRLYGLCLDNMRNIKFQEAQSKNVVALSMVPWGCESSQLLKFISEALASLQISLTHPKCIIVKGYIFIQFSNFYEALYSKNLLNNMVFQNQRLKAQLSYGSSFVYQGKYKYNFEMDHCEELIKKLADIRTLQRQSFN